MTTPPVDSARLRYSVMATFVAGTLALAGCQGGGPPPGTTETTTASATPSATPVPAPTAVYKPADAQGKAQNVPVPVKPGLADENSKAGLEAFVGYWFALLNYGYETGDVSAWSTLSSPTSVYCNNIRESIKSDFEANVWQVGGRLITPSIGAKLDTVDSVPQVVVQVLQDPAQFYNAAGSLARDPNPASNSAVVVLASFADGHWSITDMHPIQ